LANSADSSFFKQNLLNGLDSIAKLGDNNPFLNGFALTKNSNDLVYAGLSQIKFCQNLKILPAPYEEWEAAWRDWLFGCNPSGILLKEISTDVVANSLYYLSGLQQKEQQSPTLFTKIRDKYGAIVQKDTARMKIQLVFTGHEFADGGQTILDVLKKNNIKASFFLTGDFYRNFPDLVKTLKAEGHYLGAHSDKHILYCDWKKRDSLLVSKADFRSDLKQNFVEMSKFGIAKDQAKYFLPPFEWYNSEIAAWCREAGLELVNYTSGTRSHADYTTPNDKNYLASKTIYRSIMDYEMRNTKGLNGFILLMHMGSDPLRTDKMYLRLERLVQELKEKGYSFERF
jgi:peptidoglycan/xylan/chitin deacetylase (PgdA/CDA1 family)